MEGVLCVPPDRGTIIGRAIWKARYVVIGVPQAARQRQQQQLAKANSSSRQSNQQVRVSTSHSQSSQPGEALYLCVFKNKGDWEPIQQHAISSITDCQVQMVAHRKQGPVLPTLVINISPDPVTDKIRKRRSSRTAGFTSTKETLPATLWFRPSEENQHSSKHILHDWCRFIQSAIQQPCGSASSVTGPMSPVTPVSPTFVNPFSPQRPRDISDVSMHLQQLQQNQREFAAAHRPGSDNRSMHSTGPNHMSSSQNHIYTSRDRPMTFSESPSLRSRRSDLSHTSSTLPHIATQGFGNSVNGSHNFDRPYFQSRPTDLPSPATTVGEFQGELIEGWTSAQGRSSAISSPIRGRGSISSAQPQPVQPSVAATPPVSIDSSSPPAPRETILDRAFQLHFIPGSERTVPGEEKLSSLARFEALMREADSRRRERLGVTQAVTSSSTAPALPHTQDAEPKSGWDDDDDDEDDDDSDLEDDHDDDIDSGDDSSTDSRTRRRRTGDTIHMRASGQLDPAIKINPNARRALDFIAARHDDADQDGQADPSSLPSQSSSASSSYSTKRAHMAFARAQAGHVGGGGGVDFDAPTLKNFDSGYCSSHPSSALQGQETHQTQQPRPQQLLRPQTSPPRNRPAVAQRSNSQTNAAAINASSQHTLPLTGSGSSSSATAPVDSLRPRLTARAVSSSSSLHRSATAGTTATYTDAASTASAAASANSDKRQSSSSAKHLSFTEFTKRLSSSTNSLLLVQTNASSNSGTGSVIIHEADASASNQNHLIHHAATRLVPPPAPPPADRCGWRGSVGVFGAEGGFL